MRIRQHEGLTFDDVLLMPHRSPVQSRRDTSTATELVPGISLAIPIISANMDTATESEMAITMARAGGLGVIHRFMSAERQAAEVRRVKRAENLVVEKPFTVGPDLTVDAARVRMVEWDTGGLLVTDSDNRLLGILTTRDVLFADDGVALVRDLMTPRDRLITAPPGTTLTEARAILHRARVEKLPLIDEEGRVRGLITSKDIVKRQQFPEATKDRKGRLRVAAAVGVKAGEQERAGLLVEAGVDVLVLDIAHGHSDNAIEMTRRLCQEFAAVPLIAGNVATGDGVRDLVEAGATAIKVGVGPGSICVTRVVTGFGVPQLTAIMESAAAAREAGVPIIADGGIRASGDVVKALAAGAQSVMIGSLFAGTRESPGRIVQRHGRRYKVTRGMASLSATMSRQDNADLDWNSIVPEGVEAMVPYRGSVNELLMQLVGGVRSGLSYCGAYTIAELQANAEFIKMSPAGVSESKPHDVELV